MKEYLSSIQIHNHEQFLKCVCEREKGRPLITVSNHDSCIDDPLIFGSLMPVSSFLKPDSPQYRWAVGAKEVCFSNPKHSLFFRLGKVLPIIRGNGVYQTSMNEVLKELNRGDWLHIYPEGKINMTKEFIRLKWGVGRLVADSKTTPLVLPFFHYGMDTVLPNEEPYKLRMNKKATIVVGKPLNFDDLVKSMKSEKKSAVK